MQQRCCGGGCRNIASDEAFGKLRSALDKASAGSPLILRDLVWRDNNPPSVRWTKRTPSA